MEQLSRLRSITLFALAMFAFSGCDSTGVGSRGSDGFDGRDGVDGADGIVNVRSVNFTFSVDAAVINGTVASLQFDVPAITASVVDDGAVLMFFRDQGTWTAMPFTYGVESEDPDLNAVDYTVTLSFGYDDGFIEPFYESSIDIDMLPLDVTPDREMKAVIIDAFLLGKKGVDHSSWEAVKEAYNLED